MSPTNWDLKRGTKIELGAGLRQHIAGSLSAAGEVSSDDSTGSRARRARRLPFQCCFKYLSRPLPK